MSHLLKIKLITTTTVDRHDIDLTKTISLSTKLPSHTSSLVLYVRTSVHYDPLSRHMDGYADCSKNRHNIRPGDYCVDDYDDVMMNNAEKGYCHLVTTNMTYHGNDEGCCDCESVIVNDYVMMVFCWD
mmetsp:Transcript_27653/g.33629  ORF Transcript_27653/g.33629 Transcript_27653/m.33629 type:complete len:128 (+) Transcript_27653:154-537(+)